MALSGSEINNTQGVQANSGVQSNSTVNVQVGTGAGVNKAQANTTSGLLNGTSLGFKNQNLGILNRKGSSEQCRKIAGIIKNVLEDKEVEGVRVDILDKSVVTHLAYSGVIMSTLLDNGEVTYLPLLIPGTGREAKTAQAIVNEYASLQTNRQFNRNTQPDVFTYDQALDGVYDAAIKNLLIGIYKVDESKLVSINGMVLPANLSDRDVEDISTVAAVIGANSLIIDRAFQSGYADLNLNAAIQATSNPKFKLNAQFNKHATNLFGQPVRSDFELSLEVAGDGPRLETLNNSADIDVLARVNGFVDAIPTSIKLQNGQEVLRLRPHVILTNVDVDTQSPAYLLLAILGSTPILDKSMWPAPLIRNIENVGHLNKIVNLEGNANQVGRPIVPSKQVTELDIRSSIYQMFCLDPALSIDIENYGVNSYFTSILAAAAHPTNLQVREDASRQIINTAHQLTGGAFPLDFPTNKIFQSYGVKIPMGIWSSKQGDHDIRDIDLAFIASKGQDIQSILRWANSNYDKTITGADPFGLKVEGIAELVPDAVISGSATRVTFTSDFIITLTSAAIGSGIRIVYEAAVSTDTGLINWAGLPDTFGGIGQAAYSGIATQFAGNTQASYYSPYTNMGMLGR